MELQWPLMIFTLFVSLGAGVFAVQGILSCMGKGSEIQIPALITSFVAIVIGGIGSFLHLQHWERFFNGFAHLSSGITQELVAIVIFCIALFVYFIMLRKSEDGNLPKWCGVMAIVVAIAVVVVMSHSYNMAARPAWNTPLLWFYYLGNAALFGSLAVMIIMGAKKAKDALLNKVGLISGVYAAVITFIYAIALMMMGSSFTEVGNYFDPTHPTKAMIDPGAEFSGLMTNSETALLFWIGVVVVGLLIPLIALVLGRKKEPRQIAGYAGVGVVCAMAGGMCFRVLIYLLGSSVFLFY